MMKIGKVILAGAGCGDAELITIKLQRCLQNADIIIADRLVNTEIITLYANKNAQVIIAGKEGYNQASYTQEQVTQLIIDYALKGHTVLRLKGGDIAFFSNVLHELQAITAHTINYEIIPGITAASGASAYTGIPLTARGYALGVQFITFNPTNNQQLFTTQKWQQLATTTDTLVLYMGAKNLTALINGLLHNGINTTMPMAIIEQATTAAQQVHISTIGQCLQQFANTNFSSPTLIIIGSVVQLHQQFAWFNPNNTASVFAQLG
jgi:uroporphyrin-III C-methyltransferase